MKGELVTSTDDNVDVLEAQDFVKVGQWVWVIEKKDAFHPEPATPGINPQGEWFGCVSEIGTNYVRVISPSCPREGHHSQRVHFDLLDDRIKIEDNPDGILAKYVTHYQNETHLLMLEVQELTAKLGFNPHLGVGHDAQSSGGDLVVLSGASNVEDHKKELILAQDETLPELFDKIKKSNKYVAKWMGADLVKMEVQIGGMESVKGLIADRIFNVSLYAGLVESVECIKKGKPAPEDTKLHIMQRKMYMDEECLANYTTGGMEFGDITDFDKWVTHDENLNRLLPFDRCIVAMQVRRRTKERNAEKVADIYIHLGMDRSDKYTYLYIRNGSAVYRLTTELEFDKHLFPDQSMFDPDVPQMMEVSGRLISNFMSVAEYDDRVKEQRIRTRNYNKWEKENGAKEKERLKSTGTSSSNPYWDFADRLDGYVRFDQSTVYYDDGVAAQKEIVDKYNRIVLIIQGLFDRSQILHPHPPVKTWTPQGFAEAITLIYDGGATLTHGKVPNFEYYRARCNRLVGKFSVFVGQNDFWEEKEANKENRKRDRYTYASEFRVKRYKPYDNNGPGMIAKSHFLPSQHKSATFSWTRPRMGYSGYYGSYDNDDITCKIKVPMERMLNISAYTVGDYKKFFTDPRTRQEYLKWAPYLLAAEEYYAGNLKIKLPLNHKQIKISLGKKKPKRKAPELVNNDPTATGNIRL